MPLKSFMDQLATTGPSLWIQETPWVIPTVQSVHIAAIAIIMASSAMLSLRMAGLIGRDEALRGTTARFLPWVWWALVVQALTGARAAELDVLDQDGAAARSPFRCSTRWRTRRSATWLPPGARAFAPPGCSHWRWIGFV